jgi:hypothetical protein
MSVTYQQTRPATPPPDTAIATDEVSGLQFQRVKLDSGAAGASLPVTSDAPLPVYSSAVASSGNSTTTPLASGATFTGSAEQNSHTDVMVSCVADNAGTLYFDFSVDGTNWNTFPTAGFAIASGIHEFHTAVKGPRYFRVRLVNSTGAQSYLRLYTYYGQFRHSNAPLNQSVSTDADAIITRSVLMGATTSGSYVNVPVTEEGHIEVAVHDPRLPFGSLHAESLTPIFQSDAVYGINPQQQLATTSGSGTATATDSSFVCSTGTTVFSFGTIQSRKRLRYRAGQGVVARFAGGFTAGVADSIQVMGVGHAEDGYYFGYNGTAFGILHVARGVREVRTLTVTTASTATNNYNVTLNGTTYNVTATNNGSTARTAYEISQGTFTGWDAEAIGSTVVFVRNSAGAASGSYSLAQSGAGTPAAGTFAQTKAGVASTDTWYAQSTWNGDKLDGTGASGVTIDPTKGNVYQIGIQYLGYGTVSFKVEVAPDGDNNADFVTVHTLKFPNTLTATHVGNPSFPFTMAAYSAGSTTDLRVYAGSFAGMIEGQKILHGPRFSYVNTLTTVGATNFQALFTIQNKRYYGGRSNQSVINLLSVSGALKHTQPCIFYLIKNGTLAGTPNFQAFSVGSCSNWDTAATTVSFSDNSQILWTGHLGETGDIDHHFTNGETSGEITLQPGEWITLAAKASTGTPAYVTGSINTREDQ